MSHTVLKTEAFSLSFAYDGMLAGVYHEVRGELLGAVTGEAAFVLDNGFATVPLCHITVGGGQLTAASDTGTQAAVFRVHPGARYLAFTLESVWGIPDASGFCLRFTAESAQVKLLPLDYMTESSEGRVHFRYLYHKSAVDPKGGFALYCPADETEEDDILLDIWVEQEQPHSLTDGVWDRAAAKRYVDDWLALFGDRSQMIIEAATNVDLYAFTPYLERMGARQVYLFTNTWRSDNFFPKTDLNWGLNRRVFPGGAADLRAYAEHLRERGIKLALHYVSGGIAFEDPVYVGSRPDSRLAGWGVLRLAEDTEAAAAVLKLRPEAGVEPPYTCTKSFEGLRFPGLRSYFNYNILHIGDELVRFKDLAIGDDGVWTAAGCERGLGSTVAAAYREGDAAKGLVTAYDVNFVPANNSDLLDEIAGGYAELINGGLVMHTVYDGAEIHTYEPWGYRKFAQRVYERLDHPVTAHDSFGGEPQTYFHYNFNSVRRLKAGDCAYGHICHHANIMPYSHSRKAANHFEAHYNLSIGHAGRALGIALPEPMFGETLHDLRAHGGTERILEAVRLWKVCARRMLPAQHDAVENSFYAPKGAWARYNNHRQADFMWEARCDGGRCRLVPTYVLRRERGDAPWQFGQEHGCLSPRQYVRGGETLTLINPAEGQPPGLLLQVLWSVDEEGPALDMHTAGDTGRTAAGAYDVFEESNRGDDTHASDARPNLEVTPLPDELSGGGDMDITPLDAGGYRVRQRNGRGTEVLDAEVGACWTLPCDMRNHRGMAFTVRGDGSGAVLAVKIDRRDYVVTLDFIGERRVVIPHGEAAWYSADWGFRMDAKSINYRDVGAFSFALGRIPAHTAVDIDISRLYALREEPARLDTLSLVVNGDRMTWASAGGIASGDIVEYTGARACLYDKNWNLKEELTGTPEEIRLRPGENRVAIEHTGAGRPFFELQLIARGAAMELTGG